MTTVPGWGALVFGGRSSPLKPFGDVLSVTYDLKEHTASSASMSVSVKEIECSGCHPQARWRHSATLLKHNGKDYDSKGGRGGILDRAQTEDGYWFGR